MGLPSPWGEGSWAQGESRATSPAHLPQTGGMALARNCIRAPRALALQGQLLVTGSGRLTWPGSGRPSLTAGEL